MKKIGFIICAIIIGTISMFAQTKSRQQLQECIGKRRSVIIEVSKSPELKDSLISLLWEQIADYRNLNDSFDADEVVLSSKIASMQIIIENQRNILDSLKTASLIEAQATDTMNERMTIINSIIEFEKKITSLENKALDLELKYGKNRAAYPAIKKAIESDVDKLYSELSQIMKMNLSLLSEEQQEFFQRLKGRYNAFEKYY